MKIFNLKCASCSAPLQIKPETTEFACAYCGAAQIVDRSGGAVTLELVTDAISKVQQGTDRTAAELALVRLNAKLNALYEELDGFEESLYRPLVEPDFPRPKKRWFSANTPLDDACTSLWNAYDEALKNKDATARHWQEMADETRREISEVESEIAANQSIVKRF
jgi:hypothetical protein